MYKVVRIINSLGKTLVSDIILPTSLIAVSEMFAAVALTQPASVNVNSVAVVVRPLDTPLHTTVKEVTGS